MFSFMYKFESSEKKYKYLSKFLFDKYKAYDTVTMCCDSPTIAQRVPNQFKSFIFNNIKISVACEEDAPVGNQSGYTRPHRMVLLFDETTGDESYVVLQKLVEEASKYCNDYKEDTITVYNGTHYEWDKVNSIKKRDINTIYTGNDFVKKLYDDLLKFNQSEKDYAKFGMRYKRSYLFHGPPGTGKSAIISALASCFNKSIGFIHFDKHSTDRMLNHLIANAEPDWIIFEDVDTLFQDRETDSDRSNISFSGFLNIIDGMSVKNGIVYFMTTNHPERLDPALIRSGRVDMACELSYLCLEPALQMFNTFCPGHENDFKKLEKIINKNKVTPAMFENVLFKERDDYDITKIINNLNELIEYYFVATKKTKTTNPNKRRKIQSALNSDE